MAQSEVRPRQAALLSPELLSIALEEIKRQKGPPNWSVRVVVGDKFTVTAICQAPGTVNDRHYHIEDECWYVAEGEIDWVFDDQVVHAKAGDFVFAPAHRWHHIFPKGDKPSIRIAVSVTGEFHRHE